MLGSAREDGGIRPVEPGATGCYVVGSREFVARDPEGNLWSFGSYRGEPRGSSGTS
jgi:hypothetical protein